MSSQRQIPRLSDVVAPGKDSDICTISGLMETSTQSLCHSLIHYLGYIWKGATAAVQ